MKKIVEDISAKIKEILNNPQKPIKYSIISGIEELDKHYQ